MSSRVTFEISLVGPEDGDDEWEATFRGFSGIGDTAREAVSDLVEQLEELVEDAEYYRVHAPGVYGHPTGRTLPQVQRVHDPEIQKGRGRQKPSSLYPSERQKDRVPPRFR